MKKRVCMVLGVVLVVIIIIGMVTNYVDSGRVGTGHEPKYCIKLVSYDGSKVTYWGLGYKVVRYVGVSPNEPYENNIGAKMGSWFMKYELPKSNAIEIEYEGQTITIMDIKDIGTIENIVVNAKYNNELCNGINTHKITLNNEIYYIKEDCKEIQKGDKQAKITDEDLETINHIISNNMGNEPEEQSFFGKVVQSDVSYIIVEPNENEEERKSADKISISLGENNDALYVVGTNVKITYDGNIMESYPAQVKATKIELKSVEEFSLVFYQKTMIQPKQKEVIISKGEMKELDYNIYAYEGHIAINLNNDNTSLTQNSMSLRDALLQNKITIEEIIAKANKDIPNAVSYDDGGSMEYHYENYTIIKCHTLDGNRDVYIGSKDMTMHDLEI